MEQWQTIVIIWAMVMIGIGVLGLAAIFGWLTGR